MNNLMNILNLFGGMNGFQQRFNSFAQNFQQQSQISPQQRVQQLLDSGQMSQEQFNQLSQIANMLTGSRRF